MASAIRAGDIRQLKINSREFDVKAGDAAVGLVLNGFENDVGISGNGNLLSRNGAQRPSSTTCR